MGGNLSKGSQFFIDIPSCFPNFPNYVIVLTFLCDKRRLKQNSSDQLGAFNKGTIRRSLVITKRTMEQLLEERFTRTSLTLLSS